MTSPPPYSNEDLVEGLRNHDEDVIRYLYQNAGPMVYKLIMNSGGNENEAEDIFQEGILATYLNIQTGKYKSNPQAKLTTYLVQVCKYQWLNHLRSTASVRHTYEINPEIPDEDPEETGRTAQEERIKILHSYISRLGENCKKILRLFYWEKKSFEEMGSLLDMQPHSVKNQKYRCMKKLKEMAAAK